MKDFEGIIKIKGNAFNKKTQISLNSRIIGWLIIACIVSLGLGPRLALGTVIYTIDGGSDGLTIVDSVNGMSTIIGPVGFSAWSWGLSFAPVAVPAPGGGTFSANTLFGVETDTDSLYYFDLDTGQANLIGSLGTSFAESLAFSLDGTLYSSDGQNLYTLNTATGAANFVTSLNSGADGLAFSPVPVPGPGGTTIPSGTLFGMDSGSLFTINTLTGGITAIGSGSGNESIAFAPDGTLYGFGYSPYDLYQFSTETGSGTYIGNPGLTQLWSAAIVPVPEPATLALLGLGSLLLRRRR